MGLVSRWHVEPSQTRDRTCVPHIGRQILNHWTTREAPLFLEGRSYVLLIFESLYLTWILTHKSCSVGICWVNNEQAGLLKCLDPVWNHRAHFVKRKLFISPLPWPLLVKEAPPQFMSDALLCMIKLLLFFSGRLEGSMDSNVAVPKI